jgi:hypothetical protein
LAVIGEPAAVKLFLESEGLPSRELGMPRLKRVARQASAGLQVGPEIAAHSGQWVKLTEESAQKIKKYGLMESTTPGVSHAMAGRPGDIKGGYRSPPGRGRSRPTRPCLPVPRG